MKSSELGNLRVRKIFEIISCQNYTAIPTKHYLEGQRGYEFKLKFLFLNL